MDALLSQIPQNTALVFDLGGVLMRHSPEAKAYFRATETDAIRVLSLQLSVGRISADDFLARTGYSREVWNSLHAGIDADTIDYLRAIGLRYPIYLLSNNDEMRWQHVLDLYPGFDSLFRGCVLSQQSGVAKPDERIYRLTEEMIAKDLGYLPEILFVDDSEENRATAERIGWHTLASLTE